MADNFDFTLYTDGSGFTDHYGGFAAVVLSNKNIGPLYTPACGCSTHMETGRAEFSAILLGLHTILETTGWINSTCSMLQLQINKPRVLIVSDRQDLVGSINKIFRRKQNGDLWASFEWYAQYFDIEAVHVGRETVALHKTADRMASGLREVIMDYVLIQKENKHI